MRKSHILIRFLVVGFLIGISIYLGMKKSRHNEAEVVIAPEQMAPIYASPDCLNWTLDTSERKTVLPLQKAEDLKFYSNTSDGSNPYAFSPSPKPVLMGGTSFYFKSEGALYALLGDRIRIKTVTSGPFLNDVRKIEESDGLMTEVKLIPDGSANIQFFARGRLFASCRSINKNVNCVDAALNAKTWGQITKISYEPAVALNILCNRTPDLRGWMENLKRAATKACPAAKWEKSNDVRAICPHVPEL